MDVILARYQTFASLEADVDRLTEENWNLREALRSAQEHTRVHPPPPPPAAPVKLRAADRVDKKSELEQALHREQVLQNKILELNIERQSFFALVESHGLAPVVIRR